MTGIILDSILMLLLGLTAVIESTDGSLSYWALAHPRGVPDFHARAGWTARLPLA